MNYFESFRSDEFVNLTSMRGGCYYISTKNRDHFFKLVSKLCKDHELYFSEKPLMRTRMFFDIDERVDINILLAMITIKLKEYFKIEGVKYDIVRNDVYEHKKHVYPYIMKKIPSETRMKLLDSYRGDDEAYEKKLHEPVKTRIVLPFTILKKFIKQIDGLDTNVSGLRLIGCCKKEGRNAGVYIPSECFTLETLKNYSIIPHPDDHTLELTPLGKKEFIPIVSKKPNPKYTKLTKIEEFFKEALKIIPGDSWRNWSLVLNFASGFNLNPEIVEKWASKFRGYTPGETTDLILKGGSFSEKANLGWIYSLLKNEMSEEDYTQWKKAHNPFNQKFDMYRLDDPYTIGRYIEDAVVIKPEFEFKQAWDFLVSKLERFARLVNVGHQKFYVKRSLEKPLETSQKKEDLRNNYKYFIRFGPEGKKKLQIFEPLYRDKRLWLRDVRFDPQQEPQSGILNLWPGFQAVEDAKLKKDQGPSLPSSGLQMILDHIRVVWANGNEEHYRYILLWFASIVQRPWEKTKVALVLVSNKGAGKGCITAWFLQYVFGLAISSKIDNLGRMTSNFNAQLHNKVFVWIDELGVDSRHFRVNWDVMKSFITEPYASIERKGVDTTTERNYCNFILLTNSEHYLKLETDDRRYAVFQCSDQYCDHSLPENREYWKRLWAVLGGDPQRVANEMFTYLLDFEARSGLWPIPSTEIRQNIIEASLSSPEEFIRGLRSRDPEYLEHCGSFSTRSSTIVDGWISSADLWSAYTSWCMATGIKKTYSKNVFGRIVGKKLTQSRCGSKRTRGWILFSRSLPED